MNPKQYQIERLPIDQIDDIAPLWRQLKQHHQQGTQDFADYYEHSTFENRKAELLAKDMLALLVAKANTELIGFCVVSMTGSVGNVDSLFVSESARDGQVGTNLMQAGLDWLNRQEANPIRLLVGQGNEGVLPFYQQFGFVQRAVQMEMVSKPDDASS